MLYNSIQFKNLTADLYDFRTTSTTDGTGNTKEYFLVGQIEFFGGLGIGSGLFINTDEPLRLNTRIMNIRDLNGDQIVPQEGLASGSQYEIRSMQPILSPWGTVELYRHSVVRMT